MSNEVINNIWTMIAALPREKIVHLRDEINSYLEEDNMMNEDKINTMTKEIETLEKLVKDKDYALTFMQPRILQEGRMCLINECSRTLGHEGDCNE